MRDAIQRTGEVVRKDRLEELKQIHDSPELMAEIHEAIAQVESGDYVSYPLDQFMGMMVSERRSSNSTEAV